MKKLSRAERKAEGQEPVYRPKLTKEELDLFYTLLNRHRLNQELRLRLIRLGAVYTPEHLDGKEDLNDRNQYIFDQRDSSYDYIEGY